MRLMTTSRMLSASIVLVLLSHLGFAATSEFCTDSGGKSIALPQLGDGLGWKDSKYYTTIQGLDIDGDGQTEVLARWISGLSIYRLHNGILVRHSFLPQLGYFCPTPKKVKSAVLCLI
jgi:hypothetical protein